MAEDLLSLCTICHIQPHRYRCPRCYSLTCSLACVKRHKKWAQCNGVRDPTVYRKINDIATPAGIDHDYNYLTSIEREFDRAEKEADVRGIDLYAPDQLSRQAKPAKGEVNLRKALQQCEVTVSRAPKGMSRNKTNETRWWKGGQCLSWSVEWIHATTGEREIASCLEHVAILDGYAQTRMAPEGLRQLKRHRHYEQSLGQEQKRKKMASHGQKEASAAAVEIDKEGSLEENQALQASQATQLQDASISHGLSPIHHADESIAVNVDQKLDHDRESLSSAKRDPKLPSAVHHLETLDKTSISSPHVAENHQPLPTPSNIVNGSDQTIAKPDAECRPPALTNVHKLGDSHGDIALMNPERNDDIINDLAKKYSLRFYLHCPSLPTKYTVIAPVASSACLVDILRQRLVLEYPTIHVFEDECPSDRSFRLPDKYMLEEDYYARARKQRIEEI